MRKNEIQKKNILERSKMRIKLRGEKMCDTDNKKNKTKSTINKKKYYRNNLFVCCDWCSITVCF